MNREPVTIQEREETRGLTLGRFMAIGGATAVAFFAGIRGPALQQGLAASEAEASGGPDCVFGTSNYNTLLCGYSHAQDAQRCLRYTKYPPESTSITYGDSSTKVSFVPEDMHGCNGAGTRVYVVRLLLRDGPSGAFKPDGGAVTIKKNQYSNYRRRVTVSLEDSYDCGTDAAGSAVETEIESKWDANTGYKVPGHPKLTTAHDYKVHPIC
ncbi:MAG TPA: hypothetical protein VK712_02095 [Verrucomicrobiae bacterium]|jgi:hypothetical protein|nr:hypothetical protein [Verrucomicrobiae bacterium]